MKKINKAFTVAAIGAIVMMFANYCSSPAFAVYETMATKPLTISNSEGESNISPYTEETTWCYRTYNDHLQRRLWSNTRGIWLTDWMDC